MSQFISQPAPDVVDNLTTNDGTKALSAAQGKALNDNITTLNDKLTTGLMLEEVTNLNDAQDGWTYVGSTVTNVPTAHGYFVITMRAGTHAVQLAICRNTDAVAFTRRCSNGTWQSWKQISFMS